MLPCSESTAAKVRRNAHSGDADELVVSQSHAVALIARTPASPAFVQFSGDKWPSSGAAGSRGHRQAISWQPAAAEQ